MKAGIPNTEMSKTERRLIWTIAIVAYLGFVCAVLFQGRSQLNSLNSEARATTDTILNLAQNGDIGDLVTITWNYYAMPEKMEWRNKEIVPVVETFVIIKRHTDGRSVFLQGPGPDSNTNQIVLRFDPNLTTAMEWQKKIKNITVLKHSDVGFNEFGDWYWLQ
ncbi:MAG: hypothetical protein V4481_03680 [Patescibacteria group bacterium]